MIRVLLSELANLEAEAILRSISSDLDPDTTQSRELEVRAGLDVTERLQAMGDLPVGAAVITPGGELDAAFLIHVVLRSPEEPVTSERVQAALKNGLRRAEEWGMESLALPPLGTGAGNLDAQEAAAVMIPVLADHLLFSESPREVTVAVGTEYERDVFDRAVEWSLSRLSHRDG